MTIATTITSTTTTTNDINNIHKDTPFLNIKKKQSVFDTQALSDFLIQEQIKLLHLESIQQYVATTNQPYDLKFDSIPTLPKKCIPKLSALFGLSTQVLSTHVSKDGSTTKLLIQLPSKANIETVIMHYDRSTQHTNKWTLSSTPMKPRSTVCISSQVGCKMACSFCATGTMGFKSHLSSAEILEQLVHANFIRKCKNVVFMGMGEPFDNYSAVCQAIQSMIHSKLFHLGPKHICVSTVGVIPKMIQFNLDCPGVHLALSLHAPTQECREKIVPTAKNYPLHKLMNAVDHYLSNHDRIMIEYILIRSLNSTPSCAKQLGQLLAGKSVILNLIPYNPTNVNNHYEAPTSEEIRVFETILREDYQIRTTVRRTMGQDIDGACGQLVLSFKCNAQEDRDIEDLGVQPTSFKTKKLPSLKSTKSKSHRSSEKELFISTTPSSSSSSSSSSFSSSFIPQFLVPSKAIPFLISPSFLFYLLLVLITCWLFRVFLKCYALFVSN